MSKVILISGKQGSGKTTLQTALTLKLSDGSKSVATWNFADVIYWMHDYCISTLQEFGFKRDIVKDGKLLQLLGTEWGRDSIDKNIWVKIMQNRIKQNVSSLDVVIIGDCRFKNELEGFPDAIKVRLECDREVRKARCSQWRDNETHPSEVDLDDSLLKFDLVLHTDNPAMTTDQHVKMITALL